MEHVDAPDERVAALLDGLVAPRPIDVEAVERERDAGPRFLQRPLQGPTEEPAGLRHAVSGDLCQGAAGPQLAEQRLRGAAEAGAHLEYQAARGLQPRGRGSRRDPIAQRVIPVRVVEVREPETG